MKKSVLILVMLLLSATCYGWSINDYTDEEKAKLATVETNAEANPIAATQDEAEAGIETGLRLFSPKLIKDAIVALASSASSFLNLTDTPAAYTGQGGKVVSVKVAEDGLEFTDPTTGTGDVTGPEGATAGNLPVLDATGKILSDSGTKPADFLTGISGSETAFTGWDKDASNDFDGAYSSLSGAPTIPTVSDTAYDATSWDNNTDGATKNAIRDKIEGLPGGHDAVTLSALLDSNLFSLSTQELGLDTQTANYVFAGPASGAAAAPAFRALTADDIPSLAYEPAGITESDISDFGTYLTAETDPTALKAADIGTTIQAYSANMDTDSTDDFTWDFDYGDLINTPTIPSGNAIIDWTTDQGAVNIHSGNYTDTNTTYSATDFDIKDLTDSTSLRNTWSGKQDALGFTPENSANKVTSFQVTPDDTHYPSEKLVKDALDGKLSAEVDGSTTNEINTVTGDNATTTSGLAITVAGAGTVSTAVSGDTLTITGTGDGTGTDDQTAAEVSYSNTTSGMTATDTQAAIDEIEGRVDTNDAKVSNVSTALSIGTKTATTLAITSDGGADDVTLPEADTDNAGLLGADKWDEIVANSAARHADESDASTTVKGIIEIADDTEALAGTDTGKAMTAAGVKIYADANDSTGTDDQTASEVSVTTTNFAGHLANDSTSNTVQKCLDLLDDLSAGFTNLTSFVSQTAWRVFYSNADGDVTELAFGDAGKVFTSGGASAAPTWETPTPIAIANENAASSDNVGTIRYRVSGNNSYLDVSMQTGAATYAWVNIVEYNW